MSAGPQQNGGRGRKETIRWKFCSLVGLCQIINDSFQSGKFPDEMKITKGLKLSLCSKRVVLCHLQTIDLFLSLRFSVKS